MTPEQEQIAELFISTLKNNNGQPLNWKNFAAQNNIEKPHMNVIIQSLKESNWDLVKEPDTSSSMVSLTKKGWAFTSFELLKSSEQEKENLELQRLRSENMLLVEQLADFPKVKKERIILRIVAVIELLIILAGLFLQWKCLT